MFPIQLIVDALQKLAHGVAVNALDKYLQMPEKPVVYSFQKFRRKALAEFGIEYKWILTETDLKRVISVNASDVFPGCIDNMDCQK